MAPSVVSEPVYWPRTTSSATCDGAIGRSESNTFTVSLRTALGRKCAGGSMAIMPTTCSRWFWNMSRSAPEPS